MRIYFTKVLILAKAGDSDAFAAIIKMFDPLITNSSKVHGRYDEDCKQYILFVIAKSIPKFEIR